jgi:hypothetical protein
MAQRGLSKSEFSSSSNRYVRVKPLVEQTPTFAANVWNDLQLWGDQFVWME